MIESPLFDDLLREFPTVRELEPDLLDLVRETSTPLRAEAGVVAFEEGSICSAYPMLTRGRIRVVKPAPNGREIGLYRVDPGEVCVLSLNCLMAGTDFTARGIAARDCEGVTVPQATFVRLLEEAPGFRMWVFHSLSERILGLMALVEEVAFSRLDQRLARILVDRTRESQKSTLKRTHQEFADELGSVREIVSRILGSFSDAGYVRLERGQVQVLDADALQKLASRA